MAPRFNHISWLLPCIIAAFSCPAWGFRAPPPDTVAILKQDTLAYRLYLSKPDSSIALAMDALQASLKLKNRRLEGLNYYILSKAYWAKANFSLAAEYGFKSLRIFENSGNVTMWGKSLLGLARTFIDLHNHEQGSAYIERTLALCKEYNDQHLLGEAYREKSMLLSETKDYDSALAYADRGLALFEKLGDSVSISILYGRKAKIFFFKKDYRQSSLFNRKSMLVDSLVGNRRALGITYYQAALDAIHLNRPDSALALLKKSIPINLEIRNVLTLIKVYTLMGDLYQDQGKPELAYKHLRIASQYKDSLYNAEKSGQIQEMQSLYELSSKEHTIERLEQDNLFKQQQVRNQRWFAGFLLVGITLLGLVVFILTRYRRLQDRTNRELASKNSAIEQQKEEISSQAETLQQLNLLKSKLFSVISHDLRGPMATLHSLLDLLVRKKLSPDEFISVSDKLKGNLDVTQRTLENLLNWSLSQMEGLRTDPRVLNVRQTIEDAIRLMGEPATVKNINIIHNADADIYVTADSDQLHLILRNLIHNAIKFSKPYGDIFITTSENSEYCEVSVRDNGIGMTKAEIDTVVSARHHFSKTGTMQEKGTGLGLLLCREFIKLNGGDISIKSGINQGTEVVFTIPLAKDLKDILV